MARFLFFRLLLIIPVVIAISFISFGITQLAPGDYLTALTQDPRMSAETIERMRRDFRLDDPWLLQYAAWLLRAVRLDFGDSLAYHIPVTTLLG
jgi:peptide/nickel transport system permease protein